MANERWQTLHLEHLSGKNSFFGKRKKKLDPSDFVEVVDNGHAIDICHQACFGKLSALLSFAWDVPVETWTARSLKLQLGGVPIKHDLHCTICDSEKPEWIYEHPKPKSA